MITAVIIDDEKNNIHNLEGLLTKYCPEVNITGFALNADDGALLINAYSLTWFSLTSRCRGKQALIC